MLSVIIPIIILKCCMLQRQPNLLVSCITVNNQIFNDGHFKIFYHSQTITVLLRCFYKSFLQMCFIFSEILGKISNKYSKKQVSDDFQIIPLNWVRIYRTLMEKLMAS